MVSFAPLSLYALGKSPHYPSNRKLTGPQSQSGRFGKNKCILPLQDIEKPEPSSVYPSEHIDYAIPVTMFMYMYIITV